MSAPQGQLGPVAYLLCLSGSVLSRCIYCCSHGLFQPLGESGAGGRREQAAGGSELGSVSFFNESKSGLPHMNTVLPVAVHPLRDLESDSQYVVQRPRPTLIESSVGLSFLMPSIASRMSCFKKKITLTPTYHQRGRTNCPWGITAEAVPGPWSLSMRSSTSDDHCLQARFTCIISFVH